MRVECPCETHLWTPCKPKHACAAKPELIILVHRAYDPSGLRQESRALGATILKYVVCIYGACLKWLLPEPSIPAAGQKDRRLWGREWELIKSKTLEIDYFRVPCLGADEKIRGLWEQDWEVRESRTSGVGLSQSLHSGQTTGHARDLSSCSDPSGHFPAMRWSVKFIDFNTIRNDLCVSL